MTFIYDIDCTVSCILIGLNYATMQLYNYTSILYTL